MNYIVVFNKITRVTLTDNNCVALFQCAVDDTILNNLLSFRETDLLLGLVLASFVPIGHGLSGRTCRSISRLTVG